MPWLKNKQKNPKTTKKLLGDQTLSPESCAEPFFISRSKPCDPWRVQVKWESGGDAHSTNSLCYDTWSSSLFECPFLDLLGRLFVVTLPLLPHK